MISLPPLPTTRLGAWRQGLYMPYHGLKWLRRHRIFWTVAAMPLILVIFALGLALLLGIVALASWLSMASTPGWYLWPLYIFALHAGGILLLLLGALTSLVVLNIILSPFLEYLSVAVETSFQIPEAPPLSLKGMARVMLEETKKGFFLLCVNLSLLMLPAANILAPLIFAFSFGWTLCDYPLARRQWAFRRRLKFVLHQPWGVFGLGCWAFLPTFLPWPLNIVLAALLMPAATVGGTMLTLQRMPAAALSPLP